MKSFSFARALTVGCLLCVALPIACGDDETTPTKPGAAGSNAGGEPGAAGGPGEPVTMGGAGGAASVMLPPGISDSSKTETCGADKCTSAAVGPVFIDPCCATDGCGLDTGFLALVGAAFSDKCQAKDQPGEPDTSCADTPASTIPFASGGQTIMVPINGFVGCCRNDGMCGVVVDDIVSPALGKIATLGLGCVDAAPFFPDSEPQACGAGGGGAGGAGAGGATGMAGMAGMAGATQ